MSPSAANKSLDNRHRRTSSGSNSPNKRPKIESVEHDTTKANTSKDGNVLIWFRSDLRTNDNPALAQALELVTSRRNGGPESKSATAIAIFIMSPKEFKSHDVGAVKLDFILRNLRELSTALWDRYRIPLLVKTSSSAANVISDFKQLCKTYKVSDAFANQEFEVDETRRDNKLSTVLSDENINFHLLQDQCVVKPGELKSKSSNSVYTVYSPFKRRWFEVVKGSRDKYLTEAKALTQFKAPFNTETNLKVIGIDKPDEIPHVLEGFELDEEKRKHLSELWPAGEHIGLENLNKFCSSKSKTGAVAISKYQTDRNFPNLEQGTSRLSPYLAVGALSTKQCIVKAMAANGGKLDSGNSGIVTWIQELIWRDFYRHVLVGFPHVCKNKPFKLETMNIQWIFDDDDFKAWCEGRTGYPIVDAGMRQLQKTGWMHNRVRMTVASFLTKHLLHNWQHGEKFFANSLIDGDFASNNGGWQWVASTGTDAQPYFRIFNPYSQSEKFDPDGIYIKRWVPELAGLKTVAAVHNPHSVLSKKEIAAMGYRDTPIVEHKMARERAIEAFKLVLGKGMKIPNPKSSQGYGNHDYEQMETKGNSEKSKDPPAKASRKGKDKH
ncbi:hypothetical protein INT43_002592, partial [Umbelopsis isabellina]